MVITIDMTTGEVHHPLTEPDDDYDMEVLCAGWNPAVDTLAAQLALQPVMAEQTAANELPADLTEAPLDAFIEDMQGR